MTEWGVVGVFIAIVGLVATLVKPMLSLNTSMTKLTMSNEQLSNDLKQLVDKNTESHTRLWQKNDEQDTRINEHEYRISELEKGDTL